jgi:hypothetical protein
VGYAYADRSTAATFASRDVEPRDASLIDGTAPEEEDDPLGWFVSLLIEANASER